MFKKNKKEEIKQEEQTIETKPIEDNGSLFGINLDAMPSENLNNDSNKKYRFHFISRHKKFFQIALISFSIVLSIFVVLYLIRTSEATKICKNLISQSLYSESSLRGELVTKGYNDLEINVAIKRCKINFDDNIRNELDSLIKSPQELYSKDTIIKKLSEKGYTDSQIEKLFLLVNWEDFLKDYIINYLNSFENVANKKTIMSEIKSAGFTESDISMISSLEIWIDLGIKYVERYFSNDKDATKADVKSYLGKLGFDEIEIENIFINIDWNNQALLCITNYIDSLNNPKINDKDDGDDKINKDDKKKDNVKITKSLFEKKLKEMGFTEDEINYAIDNYDFSIILQEDLNEIINKQNKLINKKEIKKSLKSLNYTDEEINIALDKLNWNDFAISTCIQLLAENKANKSSAFKSLSDYGYSDEEIDSVEEKIEWSNYVTKALAYLLEGNNKTMDNLLDTLEDYGYTEDEIILAKTNTNFNKFAYNYLINTVSSSNLSIIGKTEIKNILDKAGYSDDYSYVIGKFDFDSQAKKYLESIMGVYIKELKTYNYSEIVSDMQGKGFTLNGNISYAFKNYNFEVFTLEWANKYSKEAIPPSKKYLKEKLQSMKINENDNLFDKYGNVIGFKDLAVLAANYYKSNDMDENDAKTMMINECGYSQDEADYAINEVYKQ